MTSAIDFAEERYARLGVSVPEALHALAEVPLSLHCWQGDDVAGFEAPDAALSGGGIQVTGSHPGRARTIDELRRDLEVALSLIPGRRRVNLHAIYGDFGGRRVDRDAIGPEHFTSWVEWAGARQVALDFNATCFSHPRAASGFTLSSTDAAVRSFWVEHVRRCRAIAAHMGERLGAASVHNLWIPDGAKDVTLLRFRHRELLLESLEEVYRTPHPAAHLRDSVESKLFGIGSESFVTGSHELYLCFALRRGLMPCLDLGHFHPTESIADKIPALLLFFDELLLHVSRGVRWDSDHVVVASDEVRGVMEETVRAGALGRVRLALDYFDGAMNRVGAWVIGARATQRALLQALLEPTAALRELEAKGDHCGKLALFEEVKALPFGLVWDHHCERLGVPPEGGWMARVRDYEREVLSRRS